MFRRHHRAIAFVAGAVATLMTLGACSSSGSNAGNGSESNSASGTTTSTGGGAGIEQAKADVAKLSNPTAFTVAPLPSKPPAGKVVAQVNCTLPSCTPGALKPPAEALGWKVNVFEYDLTKGPQDFVRAFDQALDSKPDYIVASFVFPENLASKELDRAKAEGIPVVDVGGTGDPRVAATVQGPKVFDRAGSIAAEVALADAGQPVNAAAVVDPAVPLYVEEGKGAKDELAKLSPESKAGTIEVSLAQPAATNVAAIVNYLKSNPHTQYIIFPGSSTYPGVHQGLQAAGLLDKVKIILTFPFPNDVQAIQDGEFFACVAGEATHQWREVDVLARLSVGQQISDTTPVSPFRIVDQTNVSLDKFDPPNYQNAYKTAWGV